MQVEYILVAVAGLAVLSWICMSRGTTSKDVIPSPTLGILNLKGDSAESLIAEDTRAIGSTFAGVETSISNPPRCDVLFLYCDFGPDESVGATRNLSEIIRDSGARIVVVASENRAENIVATVKKLRPIQINLAVTLQRKGAAFPSFYKRLFAAMARGVTMPVAWNELAPQIPGSDHADCPSGFFTSESPQVTFK